MAAKRMGGGASLFHSRRFLFRLQTYVLFFCVHNIRQQQQLCNPSFPSPKKPLLQSYSRHTYTYNPFFLSLLWEQQRPKKRELSVRNQIKRSRRSRLREYGRINVNVPPFLFEVEVSISFLFSFSSDVGSKIKIPPHSPMPPLTLTVEVLIRNGEKNGGK